MPSLNEPLSTEEWESAIGRAMSKMRRAQGKTQKEIAETTGLSVSAIKKIEGGKGSSLRSLILISRALGRSSWLSSFSVNEPTVNPLEMFLAQEKANTKGSTAKKQKSGKP